MKKQLFFLFTVISIINVSVHAQEQTFTQMFDSVFRYVSRTDATTGILYNRVLPFSRLARFTVTDTANATVFKVYSELQRVALVPNIFSIFALDNNSNKIRI
jgi:hypothetical protein